MGYTGVRYTIEEGDTLWDIAAEKLGDPHAWSRLYAFNNQKDVIAAGARRISDPDMIYTGATLMLPLPPGVSPRPVPSASRPPAMGDLKRQIPAIRMPVQIAYDIKGDTLTLDYGSFIARVRQTGRVMIDPGASLPLTMVVDGGTEISAKIMAKNAFTTLMSENKVTFDPATKAVKFSNTLISSANNINGPKTEIAMETSSSSRMPVLKVAVAYPQIKGRVGADSYVALDYKVEIEIEPRMPSLKPVPIAAPSAARVPQTDWSQVLRGASKKALIAAGVITVLYGASVVFSSGGTLAGSPAYANTMAVILVGASVTAVTVHN